MKRSGVELAISRSQVRRPNLLALSASVMRLMLKTYKQHGREFSVPFNASKSACLYVTKRSRGYATLPEFRLGSKQLIFVSECMYLGHSVSPKLINKSDIICCRNLFCGKVNNVVCNFASCSSAVKCNSADM